MTILKEYRINNKLKQDYMADKLNCSISSYRLYENGEKLIPHRVLINFLRLRNEDGDVELIKVLEELNEK